MLSDYEEPTGKCPPLVESVRLPGLMELSFNFWLFLMRDTVAERSLKEGAVLVVIILERWDE